MDFITNYINQSVTIPFIELDVRMFYIVVIAVAVMCVKNIAGALGRTLCWIVVGYGVLNFFGITVSDASVYARQLMSYVINTYQSVG